MSGVHIEAVDLVFRYGDTAALSGLSLEVPAGSVTVVVGPSGSGKTTLLQVIAGLAEPERGDVRFDGVSVLGLPSEKRDLGVVFQSYALFPHLTVEDNVAFGLLVRGLPRQPARRRVAEVLERLEISALSRRLPTQLSGGERQRVALARALAFGPRALLLDEPLAALDARLRLALRDDVAERLRQAGLSALYVTHDQEEAMAVGDRVAVVRDGRVEQVGTPEDLYRRPATTFVARFFGEANFVAGRWEPEARRFVSELGAFELPGEVAAPSAAGAAELMLRPESLRPAAAGEDAHISGRVVGSTFLGGRRRLRVEASGRARTDVLKVDVDPASAVEVGELALVVDLAQAVVLAAFDPESPVD